MDGQVIAHDMKRYRNFRTMVTPKQTQLAHLCADRTGQNCIAASSQFYEIYVWALATGDLLEVLHGSSQIFAYNLKLLLHSGHTAPITGLSLHGLKLASTSADKTTRIWDVVRVESESIQLAHEGVALKYSPDGFFLAVLSLDSAVHVFDASTNAETFLIEAKLDLDTPRERNQQLKKQTVQKNKSVAMLILFSAFNPNFLCFQVLHLS